MGGTIKDPTVKFGAPTFLLAVFLARAALASEAQGKEQERIYSIWGDPKAGRRVFAEKGCGKCHPINGVGPNLGPDLGRPPTEPQTVTQIAGAMWNHAPEMRRAALEKGLRWPEFRGTELRDLIAFLYFVRMLDQPGDARRGEHLFDEKRCSVCHALGGKGGKIGPDLTHWRRFASPILWADVMWRHAIEMEGKMREMGLEWPRFEGNEMVDLIAFMERETRDR